jgi:hypothetical protein
MSWSSRIYIKLGRSAKNAKKLGATARIELALSSLLISRVVVPKDSRNASNKEILNVPDD